MKAHKKQLSIWFIILSSLMLFFVTMIFLVMYKIETGTTSIEDSIRYRNLSYIVDKDYSLEKKKHKEDNIEFLNELTEFFYTFHKKNMYFKQKLDYFMEKRDLFIKRFKNTGISIYEMTVGKKKKKTKSQSRPKKTWALYSTSIPTPTLRTNSRAKTSASKKSPCGNCPSLAASCSPRPSWTVSGETPFTSSARLDSRWNPKCKNNKQKRALFELLHRQ